MIPVAEALGMWESRRDFQEEWEGWKAGILAFQAFHSSAFPRLTCRTGFARNFVSDDNGISRYLLGSTGWKRHGCAETDF
jgi:hypothetical protein